MPVKSLEEPLRNHLIFSAIRKRLLGEEMMQRFFLKVLRIADWQSQMSEDRFTVDGTMIEAWASVKSFTKRWQQMTAGRR